MYAGVPEEVGDTMSEPDTCNEPDMVTLPAAATSRLCRVVSSTPSPTMNALG